MTNPDIHEGGAIMGIKRQLQKWLEIPAEQHFIDHFNRNAAQVTKDSRRYIRDVINEYKRELRLSQQIATKPKAKKGGH